jgi:methylornithine synthase
MKVREIIDELKETSCVSKDDIITILNTEAEDDLAYLFQAARDVRQQYFGNKIFLYGFVYFSTYCRNNCSFCFFRRDNDDTIRYRKDSNEVLEIAKGLAESGVLLIDLTLGEDPDLHKENFSSLLSLVDDIHREVDRPVMISPGVISDSLIEKFAKKDVEFYALYQETYNRELFKKLRLHQDFDARMHAKKKARECGMHVEEGLMTGLGETVADIADALIDLKALDASQIRVMTFVPQNGTPMESFAPQNHDMELKIIALMRLMNHNVLIPASLDVEGIIGLESRINAGCNVVTSIIPPTAGLAGVAQSTKDVNEGLRTVQGVVPRLEKLGMRAATITEYREWLAENR